LARLNYSSHSRVALQQAQFAEASWNLREIEKARLERMKKWMSYLDANLSEAAGATGNC